MSIKRSQYRVDSSSSSLQDLKNFQFLLYFNALSSLHVPKISTNRNGEPFIFLLKFREIST